MSDHTYARLDSQSNQNQTALPDAPSQILLAASQESPKHQVSRETAFLQNHPVAITSGFFSQHFTSDNHFNQKNFGGGVEVKLSQHNTLTVGEYYNSIRRTSVYAADEVRWRLGDSPMKAGVGLGLISGYETKWPVIPMALPMLSIEGDKYKHSIVKHLGADFVVIPPLGSKETGTPAVAAVRFKYSFGGK